MLTSLSPSHGFTISLSHRIRRSLGEGGPSHFLIVSAEALAKVDYLALLDTHSHSTEPGVAWRPE